MHRTFFLTDPSGERIQLDFHGETMEDLFDAIWAETGKEMDSVAYRDVRFSCFSIVEGAPSKRIEREECAPSKRIEREECAPSKRIEREECAPSHAIEREEGAPSHAIEREEGAPSHGIGREEGARMNFELTSSSSPCIFPEGTILYLRCKTISLHRAAIKANARGMQAIIDELKKEKNKEEDFLDAVDWTNRTALLIASKQLNFQAASVLLENGANINALNAFPLLSGVHETAVYACVKSILNEDNIPLPEKNKKSLRSADAGIDLLRLLISKGANLNIRCGIDQETVLHLAIKNLGFKKENIAKRILCILEVSTIDRTIRNIQNKFADEI